VCLDEVENQSIVLTTVLFYPEILGALKTNYLCCFKWYYIRFRESVYNLIRKSESVFGYFSLVNSKSSAVSPANNVSKYARNSSCESRIFISFFFPTNRTLSK
jgi:hypothetical protein